MQFKKKSFSLRPSRHTTLRPETIRKFHAILITTASENDKRRNGCLSTSRTPIKMEKCRKYLTKAQKN